MKSNKLSWNLSLGTIILDGILLWVFLFSGADFVYAHRVNIFAWVEGDTVHTESKLSGGKKVKGAPVEVYDNTGNKILEGQTDNNGEFFFKVPKKTEMKVVLSAGMGHRAEWTIPLDEIESADATPNEPTVSRETLMQQPEPFKENGSASKGGVEAQTAFEMSLDKKLDLIIKKLDRMQDTGPEITDILGAVGYILGLVGIAAYYNYRKKRG